MSEKTVNILGLKPCPFCGSEAVCLQAGCHTGVLASCTQCKLRTRFYHKGTFEQKEQYAKDAWNRRVDNMNLQARIDELQERCDKAIGFAEDIGAHEITAALRGEI